MFFQYRNLVNHKDSPFQRTNLFKLWKIPSQTLTWPLENGGWKPTFLLGLGNFSGANCETSGGSPFCFWCPWTASRVSIMPNMNSSRETTPSWQLEWSTAVSDSFSEEGSPTKPAHVQQTRQVVHNGSIEPFTPLKPQITRNFTVARKAWLASICSKEAAMLENQSSAPLSQEGKAWKSPDQLNTLKLG